MALMGNEITEKWNWLVDSYVHSANSCVSPHQSQETMTLSKAVSDVPPESISPSTTGQFSKFSINQDRPAKRRRNAKEAEPAGPSPSSSSPGGSSAAASQAEKDAAKNKDGSAAIATRSCAECRRMKLKCDRIFPCKTCVRRGLEGICPDGKFHPSKCSIPEQLEILESRFSCHWTGNTICPRKHPGTP